MYKIIKRLMVSTLIMALIINAVMLAGTVEKAAAIPAIPHFISGTVTVGSSPGGAGINVTAKIGSEIFGVSYTDAQSKYAMDSSATLTATSGTVEFYVNGVKTTYTTPYVSGGTTVVNLTVATLAVMPQLSIVTSSLPNGTVGASYSQTLQVSGGTSPYTWATPTGLPAGLTFSNGAISGTPTTATSYTFTVQVSDSASNTANATYSVTMSSAATPSALSINSTSIPSGTVGSIYSAYLTASGGSGAYTWTVTSGSLPAGLTLSSSGVISGTPTAASTYSFSVSVADTATHTTTGTYSVAVGAPAPAATQTQTSTSSSSSSSSTSTPSSTGPGTSPSATPAAGIAAFSISDMQATPVATKNSTQVNISIRVANTGKAQGMKTLQLKINNNVEAQQEVVLDPGESQVVTFTVKKNTPGSYKASIDPLSTDFTIDSAPASQSPADNSGIPVMGILIGGVLLAILLFLMIIYKKKQDY